MKIKQFTFKIDGITYVVAAKNEKSARNKAGKLYKAQVKIKEK